MIGQLIECEADKNNKYYRVIHDKEYKDGKRFPINEVVVSDKKIDFNATDGTKMGGFYISTYEYIFRWLIRGNILCEVIIPEDSKIYKTVSKNGIYIAEKIILENPIKIDDDLATELYLKSTLPELSYFDAMVACSICGYINTALKVCNDKVNKNNVDIAISKFEEFCKRREEEKYVNNISEINSVQVLYNRLKEIKNNRSE